MYIKNKRHLAWKKNQNAKKYKDIFNQIKPKCKSI